MVSIEEARAQILALKAELKDLQMGYHELREVETIINRTLDALERATGSKDIQKAINNIQRLVSFIRMAQMAIHAFQIASGPLGWALAATTAISTAVYVSTSMYEVNAH